MHIPVLVNPKVPDFSRYRDSTAFARTGRNLPQQQVDERKICRDCSAAGQSLVRSLGLEFMPVTLGQQGIAVLDSDSSLRVPALARQVFDVSGAGDTVIAVLALAIASHIQIEIAAQLRTWLPVLSSAKSAPLLSRKQN